MILVAGGSGRLGTLVVERLVGRGLNVRVLTRDPARAAHLSGDHLEVVKGDVRDCRSLEPACTGVDAVISAVHGLIGPRSNSPTTVDRDGNGNLVAASKAAGADLVLVSTVGASPDSAMELFRMKYAAERHAATSGVPTTIVQATAFMELWIELLRQTAGRSGRPLMFGQGDNPINFVSVVDVAEVIVRAVSDSTSRGKTLVVGGPENLTMNEMAEAVQAAAGRTSPPRHVPPPLLRLMAATLGRVKPQLGRQARAALAMDRTDLTFDGPNRRPYPDVPCTALDDVLATDLTGRRS